MGGPDPTGLVTLYEEKTQGCEQRRKASRWEDTFMRHGGGPQERPACRLGDPGLVAARTGRKELLPVKLPDRGSPKQTSHLIVLFLYSFPQNKLSLRSHQRAMKTAARRGAPASHGSGWRGKWSAPL